MIVIALPDIFAVSLILNYKMHLIYHSVCELCESTYMYKLIIYIMLLILYGYGYIHMVIWLYIFHMCT